MPSFTMLPLVPPLQEAVRALGFTAMTPVQEHALPALLDGKDVIAQARTGSGKTVAFGLAGLSRVDVKAARVQVLVLVPTRELADQVAAEVRRLARLIPNLKVATLCGGVPVRTQVPSLVHPPHVIVGTPGRIEDHLRRGTLDLRDVTVFVLDEADRMLDMGFSESIEAIAAHTPKTRQTLLFSATFPADIRELSKAFQRAPVEVTVDVEAPAATIEQVFYEVAGASKIDALATLLQVRAFDSALVFCTTRNDVRDVTAQLESRGFSVLALHGEMEQRERDEVFIRFSNGSCSVLVATDVAARGLDVKGLEAVVSFELPHDADTHVHRIGRTGRAGKTGVALSLVTPRERERVTKIEERQGGPVTWAPLPETPTTKPKPAPKVTLLVDGGKQDKLRPGDFLGALTGDVGLAGTSIGKIDVLPRMTYIAVSAADADAAVKGLMKNKVKGRSFRARRL